MKINRKILSIPPFISTSWKNILSLHLENYETHPVVVVILTNGSRIELPPLDSPIVEAIFEAHVRYVEHEQTHSNKGAVSQTKSANETLLTLGFAPFKNGVQSFDALGAALQHNSEQAESPDLPKEVLDKIAAISKAMGIEDDAMLPKAEPHCNCMHCQIARAIRDEKKAEAAPAEEEVVSLEELKFRLWDVAQTADRLYTVSNPLNADENYNVFLGEPIGCTCGEKNCEHIRAVLNT
jgi:hypothetical protein